MMVTGVKKKKNQMVTAKKGFGQKEYDLCIGNSKSLRLIGLRSSELVILPYETKGNCSETIFFSWERYTSAVFIMAWALPHL